MKMLWNLIVVTIVLGSGLASADTLINKKTGRPVSIGTGIIENRTIHWTPCHVPKTMAPKDYLVRDYRVIAGDNCDVSFALPKTGSSLPLIALLGSVLFCIGLILTFFARKAV